VRIADRVHREQVLITVLRRWNRIKARQLGLDGPHRLEPLRPLIICRGRLDPLLFDVALGIEERGNAFDGVLLGDNRLQVVEGRKTRPLLAIPNLGIRIPNLGTVCPALPASSRSGLDRCNSPSVGTNAPALIARTLAPSSASLLTPRRRATSFHDGAP
jgi:hypothetical protein